MGTRRQNGKNSLRGHGDARVSGRGARGAPGREGARGRSAEAPGRARTGPGSTASASRSVLRPRSGLGACWADRREASPSLWVLRPGLPRRPRGVSAGVAASPPPRSLPDGAPGQRTARTRARPPLTRPRTERPGRSLGVRNAPRRLGWACRAGLFQGRSQAAGRVGKCSRSPCQGCVRTLRGALKPAQFTTGTHRVPEAGTGDSSLFRRRKEEEKGMR